jgi:P pilus assembly chaperone PapD
MKFVNIIVSSIAAALIFTSSASASLRVTPMTVLLTPSGAQNSSSVQVTNITDRPLRLEATIERRFADDKGDISSTPDDERFLIFPALATLEPGASQAFRIQWLGEQTLDKSESFYLFVSTVSDPVLDTSGFALAYRFGVSVHVVPPGTAEALVATSAELEVTAADAAPPAASDEEDTVGIASAAGLKLSVRNNGTRYARMADHQIRLAYKSESGAEVRLNEEDIGETIGSGFILPLSERVFHIQIPSAPADGEDIAFQVTPKPRRD